MIRTHARSLILCLVGLCPTVSGAETRICENELVTVESADASHLDAMCNASDRALALLQSCDLAPPDPVTVSVAEIEQPLPFLFNFSKFKSMPRHLELIVRPSNIK